MVSLIYVCDTSHSCVWHVSFTCVTCLIHVFEMSHLCGWHVSFMSVTCLLHVCDMTCLIHVWHVSFMCVTCLIHVCDMTCLIHVCDVCGVTHTYMTWHTHVDKSYEKSAAERGAPTWRNYCRDDTDMSAARTENSANWQECDNNTSAAPTTWWHWQERGVLLCGGYE